MSGRQIKNAAREVRTPQMTCHTVPASGWWRLRPRATFSAVVLASLLGAFPLAAAQAREILPILTTAYGVRHLTVSESRRGYPVRLRATVMIYDPLWGMLFIHDATGGAYVSMKGQPELPIHTGHL